MTTKKLFIADFDDTLFRAAYPPTNWDDSTDWWELPCSLGPPTIPLVPGPEWWNQQVVAAAEERLQDPEWYCCVLTGRGVDEANFAQRIPELLTGRGLNFDEVLLSPMDRTAVWKTARIISLAKRLNVSSIEIWDDRADHLQEFRAALERQYSLVTNLVQETKMQHGKSFRFRGHRYIEAGDLPEGNRRSAVIATTPERENAKGCQPPPAKPEASASVDQIANGGNIVSSR